MLYTDMIYGTDDITEPVILDLINSSSLERLKHIDSAGYFEPYCPGVSHTRFEHSVGVYLLLRMYGAPIEEQIAGLIHDVSHSAFSHCIDYVLDTGSQIDQSHQDNVFDDYVKKTDIPDILQSYGFDLDYICEESNFPLKETKLPDLCADRIDYSLRNAEALGLMADAQTILHHLRVEQGRWVFDDMTSARTYALLFKKLNDEYYSGITSALMFVTVGEYLRYAIQQGYITEADLYTTDEQVLSMISVHHGDDPHLVLLFDRMNARVDYSLVASEQEGGRTVFCKSRVVDPLCISEGNIVRYSDIESSWKEIIKNDSQPKEYCIKFQNKLDQVRPS